MLRFVLRMMILLIYGVFAWSFLRWVHPLVSTQEAIIAFFTVFLSMSIVAWMLDSFTPFDGRISRPIDWSRWSNK